MERLTNQTNQLLLEINSDLEKITALSHELDCLEINLLHKERYLNGIFKKFGYNDNFINEIYAIIASTKKHTSLLKDVNALLSFTQLPAVRSWWWIEHSDKIH